jgi:hypothetical protein
LVFGKLLTKKDCFIFDSLSTSLTIISHVFWLDFFYQTPGRSGISLRVGSLKIEDYKDLPSEISFEMKKNHMEKTNKISYSSSKIPVSRHISSSTHWS